MRVLLVEDDPDLSRQLKSALADAGYAVDHAPDGEEAHFLGDTEPYDAVILDLGLPKIDGVSVLERWRREGKATPVLILTARGSSLRPPHCRVAAAWPADRRSRARSRASNSSVWNGLVR